MAPPFKPAGHSTVSPYLIVRDAREVIDFLAATFGAEPLRRHERPDGSVLHAEVRIGDSVVMMGEATGEWTPTAVHVHVYVEDVDEVYRRALDAGGTAVQEPEQKSDPDRRGGVKDPGGTTWWIATQVG